MLRSVEVRRQEKNERRVSHWEGRVIFCFLFLLWAFLDLCSGKQRKGHNNYTTVHSFDWQVETCVQSTSPLVQAVSSSVKATESVYPYRAAYRQYCILSTKVKISSLVTLPGEPEFITDRRGFIALCCVSFRLHFYTAEWVRHRIATNIACVQTVSYHY